MTDAKPCLSCSIVNGQRSPVGGTIADTGNFHAHHDVAYPVPGLIIVAARRHFAAVDEMTPVAVRELLPFVQRLRRAQRQVLGTAHTYYSYSEDTRETMSSDEELNVLARVAEELRIAMSNDSGDRCPR